MTARQIRRDLCWYGTALAITVVYMVTTYYRTLPHWTAFAFAAMYLSAAAGMAYKEAAETYNGPVAFVFAALLPIGHAMGANPTSARLFGILFRGYLIGFGVVGLMWSAKLFMDWLDSPKERSKSSK